MSKLIDWENIDTILLDMDGTLLDLHYDLHFWMEYLPLAFANKHNLSHKSAKEKIHPMLRAEEGKLHWYCVDYWQKIFELDIIKLKEEVSHLIQIHPFVLDFLDEAKKHQKKIYLVTNAHRKTIHLKMRITNLEEYFDRIISSHDYNAAKEEQKFWQKMTHELDLDKSKSVFFDDSLSVLESAKKFGIGTVVAMSKPSSQMGVQEKKGYLNIENFATMMPVKPH